MKSIIKKITTQKHLSTYEQSCVECAIESIYEYSKYSKQISSDPKIQNGISILSEFLYQNYKEDK